ncbi:ABC transporter substrate-binding protein [Methylopila jiangsuensis]|uniref:ABC transporter substrate-binding protein n=1 Tax=Methylopila jiangsuensis TaxID=586230 RepID=A0A9W6JHG7_9HYPH|nr:iron-siderophore ABC transporter substrate-binding protein [Methylopila jiangsuensis]MDR6284912.1 iron complex transport system substrate-binding protein [Methylopila jiangsuensis]GLK77700.1 ABC transporter substrate-binding protein [Methylopila jiangsuensis]
MRRALGVLLAALAFASTSAAEACEGRLFAGGDVLGAPLCLPAAPKRIVALDPTFSLGMALELGAPVVAAPMSGMSDKALKARAEAAGVADIGTFEQPSLERVIALKPDLIIGSGFLGAKAQEMAARIAPAALITASDWKAFYLTLAEVAGRADAARGVFDAYQSRVANIRARMPDVKVSVMRITPWDFQVYLDKPGAYAPFAVMREAGVKRTAYETSESGPGVKRPDWEELAALDGDVLLYIVGGANDSDRSGRHEQVISNPLWRMLPAVKAGRVHRVDAATWMEFSGLASANRVLDDIERYVLTTP